MEKIIKIGDREVGMRASALSAVLFRREFNSDLIVESTKASRDGVLNNSEIIGEMAYIFAKQYDKTIPSFEEWLDEFELIDMISAAPEIMELWVNNQKSSSKQKK